MTSEIILAVLRDYPHEDDVLRRGLFVEKGGVREFQIPERFLYKLEKEINPGDELLIKLKRGEPDEVGLPFVVGEEHQAEVESFSPEKRFGFLHIGKEYLNLFFHIDACPSDEYIDSGDLVKFVVGAGRYPGTYAAKAIRFVDGEEPASSKELEDLVAALKVTARG